MLKHLVVVIIGSSVFLGCNNNTCKECLHILFAKEYSDSVFVEETFNSDSLIFCSKPEKANDNDICCYEGDSLKLALSYSYKCSLANINVCIYEETYGNEEYSNDMFYLIEYYVQYDTECYLILDELNMVNEISEIVPEIFAVGKNDSLLLILGSQYPYFSSYYGKFVIKANKFEKNYFIIWSNESKTP